MTENVMMKPRTRVMWTAAERAEWLALYERSGQSAQQSVSTSRCTATLSSIAAQPPNQLIFLLQPCARSTAYKLLQFRSIWNDGDAGVLTPLTRGGVGLARPTFRTSRT